MPFTPEELAAMAAADAEIEAGFTGLTAEERRASDALDNTARALSGKRTRNQDRERMYYLENRERICAKKRAYYQAHREEIRAAKNKRYQERKRRKQNAESAFGRTGPGRGQNAVTE